MTSGIVVVVSVLASITPLFCVPVPVDYYKYPQVSCLQYDIREGYNLPTLDQCREQCDTNADCMGFQFRPWSHNNNCLIRSHCEKMKRTGEGWTVYRKEQEIPMNTETYASYPDKTCSSGLPDSELNVASESQCRDTCEMLTSCEAYEYRNYQLGYNCLPLQECEVLTLNNRGWDTYWSDRENTTKHFRDVCCISHGPYGGMGGKSFSDRDRAAGADGPITKIHLMEGLYIQSLSFTYGTINTKNHGLIVESYGTKELQVGEEIIGVYGYQGGFVDQLAFITNLRQLGPYGFGEGEPFNVTGEGRPLKYISGQAGDLLDQVVFHFCCDNHHLWPSP